MRESRKLLVHPDYSAPEYMRISPESAGWDWLHFGARRMPAGQVWEHATGEHEMALVILGGRCSLRSDQGEWLEIGRRPNVFAGLPYAVYLPRRTAFSLEALSDDFDVAYAWCASDEDHPAALIAPNDVTTEIRGGANATRQITGMINPGFDCQRLVAVEVYTPSGNWSSYPPHKHDEHRQADDGKLLEADLEEIYFYKHQPVHEAGASDGYAYQRVYTGDGSLDELMLVRPDHAVLVPGGYHPVVSAHGYHTYYLNFLAGSAQALTASDDPAYAWVKDTWDSKDPRLPIVSPEVEG